MVLVASARALLRLKRAETESRDAAEQWQTTFNSLAEAVAVVDGNGCLARWHMAFREICGSDCQLESGVDARLLLNKLLGTPDPLSHNGSRFSGEFQIGRRSVQLSVTPVRRNPGSGEKILVLADVTDRKLAEYALRFRTSVRPGKSGTTFEVFLPNLTQLPVAPSERVSEGALLDADR